MESLIPPAVMERENTFHYVSAFKRIKEMYSDGKLSDVVLVCGNGTTKISAHRLVLCSSSDYFNAMFTSNLAETNKNEIQINNVDGNALKALIDFIYTGKINLTDSNIFSIMSAANFLQLNPVIKACSDYLIKNLNCTNCVTVKRFSEDQSLKHLNEITFKFILNNFVDLVRNDEWLNEFTAQELVELFDSVDLNVPNEECVYETLIKWYSMNKESREQCLSNLLSHVKLPLMSVENFTREIENNRFINSSIECQMLLLNAATYHLKPEKFLTHHNNLTTPRKSTLGYVLCVGGIDYLKYGNTTPSQGSFMEKYDCLAEKWIPINSSINLTSGMFGGVHALNGGGNGVSNMLRRTQFGLAVLDNCLYLVGGRDGLKTLNTLDCYDIEKDVWTAVSQMSSHRHGLQSTFLGDESVLYAVGGHDGWSFLNSVERFDLESKTWSFVASMNLARSSFGMAVLGVSIYVVGGRDASNVLNSVEYFNPLSNKWTICASMNKKRGSVSVCTINGSIYALGGCEATSTLANSTRYDCAERYDPKLDQWTIIKNISRPREAIAATSLGNYAIYIAGGYDGHKYLNDCERYNAIKNEWVKMQPLNFARAGACLIHISNKKSTTLAKTAKHLKTTNANYEFIYKVDKNEDLLI